MLPFSDSKLKSLSYPVQGMETTTAKVFQAQNRDVFVHTGAVIAKVTNYTNKEDGIYEFDTDNENPSYQIVPWFLMQDEMEHSLQVPMTFIRQLYGTLKAWYKERTVKDLFPLASLRAEDLGEGGVFTLEASQEDCRSPDLSLEWPSIDVQRPFVDNLFTGNGKEFLDMFELIVKLDAETVTLQYSRKHTNIWFAEASTRNKDHTVTTGCSFATDEQKKAFQDKALKIKTQVVA